MVKGAGAMRRKVPVRVFVADGAQEVRERLVSAIGEVGGVEVVGSADNALETIRLVRSLRPEVVVIDVFMSAGDGLYALRALRKETPAPVFIAYTNRADGLYRRRSMEAGADFFFDKSTEFKKLVGLLEELSAGVDKAG